jgi:uncharacterized membrane protein
MNSEEQKQAQKHKIGNFLAIICVIVAVLIAWGMAVGSSVFGWALAIVSLLFGPICFVGYLVEVKRGVFSAKDDEAGDLEVTDL